MNIIFKTALTSVAIFMLVSLAVAAESTPVQVSYADVDQATAQEMTLKIQALALKRLDFETFAKSKVKQLNRNHIFSHSRMEITKQADGTYLARYHQIDDSSMSVKVRRSQSSAIPYIGILFYREQIFESTARTPEQLEDSSFAVVQVIPNRHIFSYQKGAWK